MILLFVINDTRNARESNVVFHHIKEDFVWNSEVWCSLSAPFLWLSSFASVFLPPRLISKSLTCVQQDQHIRLRELLRSSRFFILTSRSRLSFETYFPRHSSPIVFSPHFPPSYTPRFFRNRPLSSLEVFLPLLFDKDVFLCRSPRGAPSFQMTTRPAHDISNTRSFPPDMTFPRQARLFRQLKTSHKTLALCAFMRRDRRFVTERCA